MSVEKMKVADIVITKTALPASILVTDTRYTYLRDKKKEGQEIEKGWKRKSLKNN